MQDICRSSTSDAAVSDLNNGIAQYIEPVLTRSISRQLSNIEREALDLYQEMVESPLNSRTERHTTRFNLTMSSVLEVSNCFYVFHWIIIGSILLCLLVILLNLYFF